MRNLTEINSKLKYESYVHKLNFIIAKYSFTLDQAELDRTFYTNFTYYLNEIINMCLTVGFDQQFTDEQILAFSEFLYENKQYIDFIIISGTPAGKKFFSRYFKRYVPIDKDIFIMALKYISYSEDQLYLLIKVFISNSNLLNGEQINQVWDNIAHYQNVSAMFIDNYIQAFLTPKRAYLLKSFNKNFYYCTQSTINKLKKLNDIYIEENFKNE